MPSTSDGSRVAPDWRRRGVAAALIEAAKAEARHNGARRITLKARIALASNIALVPPVTALRSLPRRRIAAFAAPTSYEMEFVLSAAGLVDLLAVLPFWLGLFLPLDLRFLLVFRIVRFLKLARCSVAS